MRKWFARLFIGLLLASVGYYAFVPGWYRVATPTLWGLVRVAPNIVTDAPEQGEELRKLVEQAKSQSRNFFGETKADPDYVLCTTQNCADIFALKPRGLTLGYHYVLIGPKGINEMILIHETVHVDLHSFARLSDLLNQRFPAWFDEGLASFLSTDDRLTTFANPRDADWIKSAQGFRDWGRLHRNHSWQDTYGAAKALVTELHSIVGKPGVRDLVNQVANGANFEAVYNQVLQH